MHMAESGEMYLETILVLSLSSPYVRSVDVSEYMGFSKPSISRAMSKLREDGFIHIDENGFITLTESGRAIAEKIYERHTVLTKVLKSLGVPEEDAARDACKIEHDISDVTFEAIKNHIHIMSKS